MYSGIHVFSLANILKTGEQGVKESINNILQLNKKTYFWHFADSSWILCEPIIRDYLSSIYLIFDTDKLHSVGQTKSFRSTQQILIVGAHCRVLQNMTHNFNEFQSIDV